MNRIRFCHNQNASYKALIVPITFDSCYNLLTNETYFETAGPDGRKKVAGGFEFKHIIKRECELWILIWREKEMSSR